MEEAKYDEQRFEQISLSNRGAACAAAWTARTS